MKIATFNVNGINGRLPHRFVIPCSQFLNHNRGHVGRLPARGTYAVGSLLSGTLSWLAVATIGLAPMLVYWLARVIGQARRRKARDPPLGSRGAEAEERGHGMQRDAAPPG
jgi:hypothetical protein